MTKPIDSHIVGLNKTLPVHLNSPRRARWFLSAGAACCAFLGTCLPGQSAVVTVDPLLMNHGYLNVFNLPAAGTYPANPFGGYQFGQAWGLGDLASEYSYSDDGMTNIVTLTPNQINDPSTNYYVGGGADGNPGNKIMDANLYAEVTGTYVGQDLTFTGVVYSNLLLNASSTNQQGNGWLCHAFIKDFPADYSSPVTTNLLLTNLGQFSISLHTSSDPNHHIQYGFETFGPPVWATDPILPGLGSVKIGSVVFSAPVISSIPAVSAVRGNIASFTVNALGSITGYQWKRNGMDLADGSKYFGVNSAYLDIFDCQLADAGTYSVTITGPGGSVTDSSTLTVVDPAKITLSSADSLQGFLNVFELPAGTYPANGFGAYAFGSGWGVADLRVTSTGPVLNLLPNTIGDPATYWYQGGGAPGNPGNKLIDANVYVEKTSLFQGATMTFSGIVLNTNLLSMLKTNQLGHGWTCTVFIKDFSPGYGSSISTNVDLAALTSPVFSLTFTTSNDQPGRHVQYGFELIGPDVWATDPILAGLGSVVIAPSTYVVLHPTVTGNTIHLPFQTVSNFTYTVQYKSKLTDQNWSTLTTVSGDGSITNVTDAVTGSSRLYRVAVQ